MQPIDMIMIYYNVTSCKKSILWLRDIKSMLLLFICNYISFPNLQTFFEFLVSVINPYHMNGLYLFWDSFEWFCVQISHDAKYFPLMSNCNILALDPAVNQETGASGRRYRGITLTCGRVEYGAIATPTWSRWTSNNYITRCHRRFELVGVS